MLNELKDILHLPLSNFKFNLNASEMTLRVNYVMNDQIVTKYCADIQML